MIDLYLFNTIVNTIWYIFTILFVLYRFTSFFSYIYNFVKFCGKLFLGVNYAYNQIKIYIKRRSGYINLNSNDIEAQTEFMLPDQNARHKTIFETFKETVTKKYNYYYYMIFGKQNTNTSTNTPTNTIQLLETTSHNNLPYYTQHSEQDLFDKHINELCANNSSIEFDNYITSNNNSNITSNNNSNITSNYNSNITSNNSNYKSNDHDDDMFKTVDLNTNNDSFLNSNYFKNYYEPVLNKPYNVEDSNILFDSNFMNNHVKGTIKIETYPKANCSNFLSQSFRKSNLSHNLNIIREEQEPRYDNQQDLQEHQENQKHQELKQSKENEIYSQCDEKFPSEYQRKHKDNKFVDDNDNDNDNDNEFVDDTYKNTILKNPYI
jgi:hypothetical protein